MLSHSLFLCPNLCTSLFSHSRSLSPSLSLSAELLPRLPQMHPTTMYYTTLSSTMLLSLNGDQHYGGYASVGGNQYSDQLVSALLLTLGGTAAS